MLTSLIMTSMHIGPPSAPLIPLQQFVQRNLLKYQIGLAAFVDNADVLVVNACDARIAAPQAFVQQEMAFLRPGAAVIETDFNGLVGPETCFRE